MTSIVQSFFVLTWNPDTWGGIDDDHWNDFASGADPGLGAGNWSTGQRRQGINVGDGLILLRQSRERGVVAIGRAVSEIYEDVHYNDPEKVARYVDYEWDEAKSVGDRLTTERLLELVPDFPWNSLYGSGVELPASAAETVLSLWRGSGDDHGLAGEPLPDEEEVIHTEGGKTTVVVNRYERDPKARAACIQHHGLTCYACGFNFATTYGERGEEFIEVHHIVPVSWLGGSTVVDPVTGLRPLCSNCHSMIHRHGLITPDQLRELVEKRSR